MHGHQNGHQYGERVRHEVDGPHNGQQSLVRISEFRGSHGMEEGKGERYLASGRQYGNALLGVRYQEEEESGLRSCSLWRYVSNILMLAWKSC